MKEELGRRVGGNETGKWLEADCELTGTLFRESG